MSIDKKTTVGGVVSVVLLGIGAAFWTGYLGHIETIVTGCLQVGVRSCLFGPEERKKLFHVVYFGDSEENGRTTPVLLPWTIEFDPGSSVNGNYTPPRGLTGGSVTGFDRKDELILTFSGKGYASSFLTKVERAGAETVYVGWSLGYACHSLSKGTCDKNTSQHKLCRVILSTQEYPQNDPFLAKYLDQPCIALPNDVSLPLEVIVGK